MKTSITKEEKALFDYIQEVTMNIYDYLERNKGIEHLEQITITIAPENNYARLSTSNYNKDGNFFIVSKNMIQGTWGGYEYINVKDGKVCE